MATYEVLVGIDYAGKRAEPGDIISDIPTSSLPWLIDQNIVKEVEGTPKTSKTREPQSPSKGDK
jgi:hypothetical protein